LYADSAALNQGVQYFRGGQFDKAAAELQEAVKQEPHSSQAFFYLGLTAAKQGRHEQAAAALKRALSLNPNLSDATLALGMSYYHLGLDNLAVTSFKEAVAKSDKPGTALFFLGLTYQRQGQHQEAIDAFQRALSADADYKQSAWYNIGLAWQAQGEEKLAAQAFENAERINTDPELSRQAHEQLNGEKAPDPAPAVIKKPWLLSAHTGFEYDDNVTVSQIDTTTALSDYAAVFDVSGAYNLVDTKTDNLLVGYDFYQSVYGELSDFDLQSHRFSANGSHDIDVGTLGMDYGYTFATLGGENFFQTHSLMPNFGFSPLSSWYVNLLYNYTNKNFFTNDPRDAEQHAVGIDNYLFFADNRAFAYLGYRVEDENTAGPQFSYLGNYVTTKINSKFPEYMFKPEISVGYKYFVKDYDNITPSINEIRQDRRHTVNMAIDLHLTKVLSSRLEYQYIDAISNLSASDFKENIVTFSLGAAY
jgi:tetratricopeptide (TPR) repeat protein